MISLRTYVCSWDKLNSKHNDELMVGLEPLCMHNNSLHSHHNNYLNAGLEPLCMCS